MDKLCCDICGGALTMQPSGKTAVCDSCGMQYSAERIREKVQEIKGTVSVEGTVRTQEADFIIRGGVLERYNGNDPHVIIPDSVVRIGEKAFEGCPGIRDIAMPDSVVEIGDFAFSKCRFLEKIKFSNALEQIGCYAFCGCTALKKVSLPETVKYIGCSAFRDCTGLETINIPNHIEGSEPGRILWGTFVHCPTLREVIISEEQKEKLFIHRYRDYRISLQPAQAIFEREYTDDDDCTEYYEENCGPWYLSFKSEQLKKIQIQIQIREERKRRNECLHCGGRFTGLFAPKCAKCGKPKDY